MSDKYYVLTNSDGDVSIEELTKEELLERINEEYYGNPKFNLVSKIDSDLTAYLDGLIIIKGKCIIPHEVMTVTEFGID